MEKYRVFRIIFLHDSLAIFIETDRATGGGELFSFWGTPEEPQHQLETINTGPENHPSYAGSHMMGWIKEEDVATAWEECYSIAREEESERETIEEWYLACTNMLAAKRFVVPKPWWLLPGDNPEDHVFT